MKANDDKESGCDKCVKKGSYVVAIIAFIFMIIMIVTVIQSIQCIAEFDDSF